jgi:hypothetical protein
MGRALVDREEVRMPLQSRLFRSDSKLQQTAVSDPAHVFLGATGNHVLKIQWALAVLDGAAIEAEEVRRGLYGPSTAACVKNYKSKRNIINRSYQDQADDIVGKMTIASLDAEMLAVEATQNSRLCCRYEKPAPPYAIPPL